MFLNFSLFTLHFATKPFPAFLRPWRSIRSQASSPSSHSDNTSWQLETKKASQHQHQQQQQQQKVTAFQQVQTLNPEVLKVTRSCRKTIRTARVTPAATADIPATTTTPRPIRKPRRRNRRDWTDRLNRSKCQKMV